MKITVLLAAALLCVVCSSASYARVRTGHHHYRAEPGNQVGCTDPIMRPCGIGFGNGIFGEEINRKSLRHRHFLPDSASKEITHHNTARPMSAGLARVMAEGAGRVVAPARFIHGRLVCALNVAAALAARGIKGTGSALAKSYLHWGHASGPVPGAVAVFNRRGGGHVAIVHHVRRDGTVIYLNPSSRRQAWQLEPYRRKPIAYRVAGAAAW